MKLMQKLEKLAVFVQTPVMVEKIYKSNGNDLFLRVIVINSVVSLLSK